MLWNFFVHNLRTFVISVYTWQAFTAYSYKHSSLTKTRKLRTKRFYKFGSGAHLRGTPLFERLLALFANTRTSLIGLPGADCLAYFATASVTTKNQFLNDAARRTTAAGTPSRTVTSSKIGFCPNRRNLELGRHGVNATKLLFFSNAAAKLVVSLSLEILYRLL